MKNKSYTPNYNYDMALIFSEPSMHKTAQEAVSGVLGSVSDYVKGIYDPNNKAASALSFLGPGLLWCLGFRWTSVVYELAQALGFDWTAFFASIKSKLQPYIDSALGSVGATIDSAHITDAVTSSVTGAFTGSEDPKKLTDVIEKQQSIQDILFIKKIAQNRVNVGVIERMINKGLGRRVRKGLIGFIITVISWAVTAGLISAGFAVVGGLAASIIGVKKAPILENKTTESEPTPSISESSKDSTTEKPSTLPLSDVVLVQNKSAPQYLFTTTYNDNMHNWILNFSPSDIKDKMIQWAQELYPQLTDTTAFNASSKFDRTLRLFQTRNQNTDIQMLAVPQPFKSIKEIVDSFAYDVASKMPKDQ